MQGQLLATLRQDVGYALRKLRRDPGFALVIVLTLALGIGVNGTVFGVLDAVVLNPLHGLREPARLVEVGGGRLSYPAFREMRTQVPALGDLAAYRHRSFAWSGDGRTELVPAAVVSGNYFSVVGGRTALGRPLTAADDQPGAPPVVVVSDAFWRRALGGDPRAVGSQVRLNGAALQVVGVMAPDFRGTQLSAAPEAWVPVALYPRLGGDDVEMRGWTWLGGVGRLKDGASVEQAQAALNAAVARQKAEYPSETAADYALTLHPAVKAAAGIEGREGTVGFVVLLSAVAGLVLLIGCANVANLFLAKAMQRRKEIAVRMALGSPAARLVQQLLTESLVLCALAGVVGLLVVQGAASALSRFTLPGGISLEGLGVGAGARVIAVTAALSLATGLLFGLAPAAQALRSDSARVLRAGASTVGKGQARLRGAVLAVQVALTLVLLVGAGLFTRTLGSAFRTDLGYRTGQVALASVDPGAARYDAARAEAFYADAAARAAELPGVADVSWTMLVPMTSGASSLSLSVPGHARPEGGAAPEAEVNYVGGSYLKTLGIPLVRGREFDGRDRAGSAPVAMINETMARRFWDGRDPVGSSFTLGGDTVTVVGVVKDVAYHTLSEEPRPYAYLPFAQKVAAVGLGEMTMVVRASGDPERLLEPMRQALHGAGPDVPVFGTGTLADRFAALLMPQRMGMALLGVFGALALAVAAVGIYGLTAFTVGQRTREIGIRLVLGASEGSVLRLMLAQSVAHAVLGVIAGVALAVAAGRVAASFLYGVSPTDPATFVATSAVLLAVAVLAAVIPAHRATRMSLTSAIRSE